MDVPTLGSLFPDLSHEEIRKVLDTVNQSDENAVLDALLRLQDEKELQRKQAGEERKKKELEEKVKTVQAIFPDVPGEVISEQLKKNNWALADTIDAIIELNETKDKQGLETSATGIRPREEWILLQRLRLSKGSGSSLAASLAYPTEDTPTPTPPTTSDEQSKFRESLLTRIPEDKRAKLGKFVAAYEESEKRKREEEEKAAAEEAESGVEAGAGSTNGEEDPLLKSCLWQNPTEFFADFHVITVDPEAAAGASQEGVTTPTDVKKEASDERLADEAMMLSAELRDLRVKPEKEEDKRDNKRQRLGIIGKLFGDSDTSTSTPTPTQTETQTPVAAPSPKPNPLFADRQKRIEEQRKREEEQEKRWQEEKRRQEEVAAAKEEARMSREMPSLGLDTTPVVRRRAASGASREGPDPKIFEEIEQKKAEKEEMERLAAKNMRALGKTLVASYPVPTVHTMRAVNFDVSPAKAKQSFDEWVSSLWFAPTDFSQMIEGPNLRAAYVPFYCVLLTTVSYYRAKVLFSEKELAALSPSAQTQPAPHSSLYPSSSSSTSGSASQGVWREISGTREARQEKMICGGLMDPEEREVLAKIEGWDMETSVSLEDEVKVILSSGSTIGGVGFHGDGGKDVKEKDGIEAFTLVEPTEVWRMVEEAVVRSEHEECRRKLLDEVGGLTSGGATTLGTGGNGGSGSGGGSGGAGAAGGIAAMLAGAGRPVRDFTLRNVVYKETRYRVVYVPVYFLRYGIGDDRKYAFFVNGQTGTVHGQRPFGVGKVLGRPLQFFENILGIKDSDDAKIVTGRVLRNIDSKPCYRDASFYVIFPASHSYLITWATGFITLRNRSHRFSLELKSQRRQGKATEGTFVMGPGETRSFNYRGHWCIEIAPIQETNAVAMGSSMTASISASGFLGTGSPSRAGTTVAQWLEIVEVQTDGGKHGNELNMA